ncbi:MAG: hypothetical protein ABW352_10830, partial [Polyangiales bacterium]
MLAAALIALGCAQKRVHDPDVVESARPPQAVRGKAGKQAVDERFDAQGKLKSSGLRFSWLELPAGFAKQPGSTPETGVWEAPNMPLAKVTEYLEAKLQPGSVEARPNGIAYKQARPTHTQLPLPPVAATALEIDPAAKRVRLVIDDLTPPREPPLP